MDGDVTTFWRQLDALRETALAGDIADANRLIATLARRRATGAPEAERARAGMLKLLAESFGLDLDVLALAPFSPQGVPARAMPGFDPAAGQKGLSLVTCCMNREANLKRALASWLVCPEIDEIVIVDWSSTRPVRDALAADGIDDPRIRIVRVENETRWILSWACNLGFRAASGDRILKADADIVLAPDFFARNPLAPGQYIAGNWRTAGEDQAHVNGFFYLHRADLAAVAGFNEFITSYGWDDDDLYDRLDKAGVARCDVARGTIRHLPHSDAERLGGADEGSSAAAELARDTMQKIRRNRLLAHIMPEWDTQKTLMPFDVTRGGTGDLALVRAGWLPHPVPAQVESDVDHYARLELTSWRLGPRVLDLDRARLELLLARPFADLGPLDVELARGDAPEQLAARGGWLLLRTGPEGIAGPAGGAAAFDRLMALAAARGMAVVISGPAEALAETEPEAARACAFIPDWHLPAPPPEVRVADLRGAEPAPRLWRALDWTTATVAALNRPGPAAPALAAVRGRVFADGQHGLGNRLRAIASAAVIAERTERELVVVWQPDAHCDGRFADLFDYAGAVIEEAFPAEAEARGIRLYNYMEVEEGAAKDAPVAVEAAGDLYLRSAYVMNAPLTDWESENRWLRGLTPVAEVREMMAGVRHPNDISAHVRMAGGAAYEHLPWEASDGNWSAEGHAAIAHWREKSHFSHFLKRIDALTAEGRAGRIFLAADAPETYEAFRACYGDRLAMLERAVYDRSAAQLRYALADALLLGRAPLLLGSTWSSFSELAMRMAPQQMVVEMSGKDF